MGGFRMRVAGGVLLALLGSLLVAPSNATAAPAAAGGASILTLDAPTGSDATLSALTASSSGSLTPLAPGFSAANHYYQVITDNAGFTVTPVATDSNATVVVSSGSTPVTLTSGTAAVTLARGRNEITVQVIAADSSTSQTYHLAVWFGMAPEVQIVGISVTRSSVLGGVRTTVSLRDGTLPGWPNCYSPVPLFGGRSGFVVGSDLDPDTGITRITEQVPGSVDHQPGIVDVEVPTYCSVGSFWGMQSRATAKAAFTYADDYTITSAEIPDPVTVGSAIVLHGPGVAGRSDARFWIKDAQGGVVDDIYYWYWTGEDTATVYLEYPEGEQWAGSGPRTLYAGTCPNNSYNYTSACTSFWSRSINWQSPAPSDLSFSPAAGPLTGGTKVRLKGRFLVSGELDLTVKVGNQTVQNFTRIQSAWNGNSFADYTQGYDIIEFEVPAATAPGPVRITASTQYGSTTTAGSFTYAARPTITSIGPATVANSGGSVITVQGTEFGASGRPTVIVGGVKSPLVTRVTSTKLTAVVPASSTTGAVNVQVSSAQGGGISDPATLTLTAPSALPVISQLNPTSAKIGDAVTITGTGFGAAGTVGVSVDGMWARVTASTGTSLTFEVPATDGTGAKDVVVATVTGLRTSAGGLSVLPQSGITSVTPATIASYATGSAATINIAGNGFGSTGTVKVGSAPAVAYTATGGGTLISGVTVATGTAGSLPIVVTPSGAATALRSSVRVTAPVVTYVGPNPYNAYYLPASIDAYRSGSKMQSPTAGGTSVRVQGTGFGSGGTLKVGSTTATVTSWSDTAIVFTAPAHAAATTTVTVTPTGSTLSGSMASALNYVASQSLPTLEGIASTVDLNHSFRNEFDPVNDLSDGFTLTGTHLGGTTASATRVIVSDSDGGNPVTLTPGAVSDTSLTFATPRGFTTSGWKRVTVVTNAGQAFTTTGINYLGTGVTINLSPYFGSCLRTAQQATGNLTIDPAVVTITNSGTLFGSSGTVTVDGVTLTTTSYADGQVVIDMADLSAELGNPWGTKTILITPDDSTKASQRIGFNCTLTATVATTANSSTADLTVPAGTSYTLGNTTSGFIGTNPFVVAAPSGYEYVTAAAYGATGFTTGVKAGAPAAAGDYYVRVARGRATYASERYTWPSDPAPVHVTITGTPITITAASTNGASFTYKGALGDGTNGSPTDFTYTPSVTTDPITKVVWEYRNSACDQQPDTVGWAEGLPSDVAVASTACGGDGTSPAAWDVRIKSFEMKASGTDKAIYYVATKPTIRITVDPKNLTIAAVQADKVYDGTTTATLAEFTLTGVVDGDTVALAGNSGSGTFATADAGVNKPVTLTSDVTLTGTNRNNYTLTNPRPTVTGTIAKADVTLGLTVSPPSVLLSQNTPVQVTATSTSERTGTATTGAAPVTLSSLDTAVCTVSGTTVTAVAAGTCQISGQQPVSGNYNAATALSDPANAIETVEFKIFAVPQQIAVIADDLTVAMGETISPTAQTTGLFDGDQVSDIVYDYYQGTTLLNAAPTTAGTYKIVPHGGTLTADNSGAYSNPSALQYVAGSLVITPVPPTITRITPALGDVTGGTEVTISGALLDTVRSLRIGDVTLRAPDFQVNDDGTRLTFRTPQVQSPATVSVTLVAGTAEADATYSYTAEATPEPPAATVPSAPLDLRLQAGNGRITVSFRSPASNGGAALTAYQVSYNHGISWSTTATTGGSGGVRSFTVSGLRNGVPYSVQMRAVNVQGAGAATPARQAMPNAQLPVITHPASEIAVPKNPNAYRGQQKYTRARNTTYRGYAAHPITTLGDRQLTPGNAATLSRKGFFGFDSPVLTATGRAEVKLLAAHLRVARTVVCEGYTDYAGTNAHELKLSQQRAVAVCKALIGYGADVTIVPRGYGGARPVIVGGTAESREANRRVVVVVTA